MKKTQITKGKTQDIIITQRMTRTYNALQKYASKSFSKGMISFQIQFAHMHHLAKQWKVISPTPQSPFP